MRPKKSLLLGLSLVGLCLLATFLVFNRGSKEFRYQGKTVKEWSLQLYMGSDQRARDEASRIFSTIGSNAVPDLIRLLRRQDPFVRRQMWSLAPKLPGAVRRRLGIKTPEASTFRAA